jgi:hypothetical protein
MLVGLWFVSLHLSVALIRATRPATPSPAGIAAHPRYALKVARSEISLPSSSTAKLTTVRPDGYDHDAAGGCG